MCAGSGDLGLPQKLRGLGEMPDLADMRLDSLNGGLPRGPGQGGPGPRPTDALLRSASQLYRMESGTEDSGALGFLNSQ